VCIDEKQIVSLMKEVYSHLLQKVRQTFVKDYVSFYKKLSKLLQKCQSIPILLVKMVSQGSKLATFE
jgi:hypothetical protein